MLNLSADRTRAARRNGSALAAGPIPDAASRGTRSEFSANNPCTRELSDEPSLSFHQNPNRPASPARRQAFTRHRLDHLPGRLEHNENIGKKKAPRIRSPGPRLSPAASPLRTRHLQDAVGKVEAGAGAAAVREDDHRGRKQRGRGFRCRNSAPANLSIRFRVSTTGCSSVSCHRIVQDVPEVFTSLTCPEPR
jgi:hypothetical protein